MQQWLRPYLDADYVATEGPDQDKEFIQEYTARIVDALPEKLSVRPERSRRILVITRGTYGVLHVPGAAGLLILLREAAGRYNGFELTELHDDVSIDGDLLGRFDAVVLNNVGRAGNPDLYNELLPAYVRGGGGLFANHGSALLFINEPGAEYNRMLGGYVEKTQVHPKRHGGAFSVELPQPEHPLVQAFTGEPVPRQVTHRWLDRTVRKKYAVAIEPPRALADELYVLNAAADQANRPQVLLRIDKDRAEQGYPEGTDDFTYALTWLKRYGEGRVFYTQLGHNMAVFSVPCVARSMLDGLQYAAGDLVVDGAADRKTVREGQETRR